MKYPVFQVAAYWPETLSTGYKVWRYRLRRDDPTPAPWTTQGMQTIKQLGLKLIKFEGDRSLIGKRGSGGRPRKYFPQYTGAESKDSSMYIRTEGYMQHLGAAYEDLHIRCKVCALDLRFTKDLGKVFNDHFFGDEHTANRAKIESVTKIYQPHLFLCQICFIWFKQKNFFKYHLRHGHEKNELTWRMVDLSVKMERNVTCKECTKCFKKFLWKLEHEKSNECGVFEWVLLCPCGDEIYTHTMIEPHGYSHKHGISVESHLKARSQIRKKEEKQDYVNVCQFCGKSGFRFV